MKIVSVMIVACCAMLTAVNGGGQDSVVGKASSTPTKAKARWVPGVYRGLVMGKSSRADALRVLGTPIWTGKSESGTPTMDFNVSEPVAGRLSVLLDHDIVFEIRLTPKETYTKSDIIKALGPGSIAVHYSPADCLAEDGMGGPLYEDPNGDFEFVEYRARGIAVDIQKDGTVGEISFVKGPLGSLHSPCPAGWNKRASYYPLAVGNWWLYTVKDYSEKSVKTTSVKWHVDSSNGRPTPTFIVSATPPTPENADLKLLDGGGRVISELTTQRTLFADGPLLKGASWSESGEKILFEVLSAAKPCTAGTRTVTDCAVIRETNKKSGDVIITTYARGVGPVSFLRFVGPGPDTKKLASKMTIRSWHVQSGTGH